MRASASPTAAQWPASGRRIHMPSRKVTTAAGRPHSVPSALPLRSFTGCGQVMPRAARCSISARKNGTSPAATRFS